LAGGTHVGPDTLDLLIDRGELLLVVSQARLGFLLHLARLLHAAQDGGLARLEGGSERLFGEANQEPVQDSAVQQHRAEGHGRTHRAPQDARLYVVFFAQKAVEEVVFFELRDVVLVVFGALLFGSAAVSCELGVLAVLRGGFLGEGRQGEGTRGGQSYPQKPVP